jgi:hypothetical protein
VRDPPAGGWVEKKLKYIVSSRTGRNTWPLYLLLPIFGAYGTVFKIRINIKNIEITKFKGSITDTVGFSFYTQIEPLGFIF